jgi:hypothetical protein
MLCLRVRGDGRGGRSRRKGEKDGKGDFSGVVGFPHLSPRVKITIHVSDRVFAALDRIGMHDPACGLIKCS